MTVATKTLPNYTTQDAASYKAAIDACAAVFNRIAGSFAAHAIETGSPAPDLAVTVDAGAVFDGVTLTEKAAQTVSGFTIPSAGQERYDRVVVDATTGIASLIVGTPSTGSPSAGLPAIPSGKLPNCYIRFQSSSTVITNSMVFDERVSAGSSGGLPAGAIVDFGGTVVATGYLACDGSNVSRTTYAALFAAIGTTWGVGNGTTTFGLPDIRRKVTAGSGGSGTGTLGSAVGNSGGAETHVQSLSELALHNHASPDSSSFVTVAPASYLQAYISGTQGNFVANTDNAGSSAAATLIQPTAVVLKMIKT